MNEQDMEQLKKGALCSHQHLQVKWAEYLKQLEIYCPDCDNLLIYSVNDLSEIMGRNLKRRYQEAI